MRFLGWCLSVIGAGLGLACLSFVLWPEANGGRGVASSALVIWIALAATTFVVGIWFVTRTAPSDPPPDGWDQDMF